MAGILGGYSDSTCSTHNALRNISGYACGVSFSFKSSADPPDMHYAVVSLQECCAKANASVMRIPGNTGCEVQFCDVPEAPSSYTREVYAYETATGTETSTPTVTEGVLWGPPGDVENCMKFVYEGDLPDEVGDKIANADSWCVVRMYDDETIGDDEKGPVTASPAPPSWTAAAIDPWDVALSSAKEAAASATSTSTSNGHGFYTNRVSKCGVRIWAVAVLMTAGLLAAL